MSCPDENALVRFARGDSLEVELEALEAHLDGCDTCRRVVAFAVADGTVPQGEPVAAALPEPGARLGHYVIDSLLGRGGMGAVFAARDELLGRRVALKLLHTGGDDELARARLAREAQVMARLSHPNVVNVYALGEWTGGQYIAMELVDGETLGEWRRSAPRTPAQVLACLKDAGRGLAAAHAAGVVHRDFKPANLLVGRDGRVRVTDFGVSRPLALAPRLASDDQLLTQAGSIVGTPAYMAPEQLDGHSADARSDQFAFCVTLVEALTGARPFNAPSREALRAKMAQEPTFGSLPRRLKRVLRRGLSEAPDRRFPSMEAVLAALDASGRPSWARWLVLPAAALVAGVIALSWPTSAPPSEAPAAPPSEPVQQSITLELGELRLVSAKGLKRIAVGDSAVLDVQTVDGQLLLRGRRPGRTTLMVWAEGDVPWEFDVRVVRRARP